MKTLNKKERAKKLTIKIFEVILEEHNGYSIEEIKKDKLGEECACGSDFERIQNLIEKQIK